jgi:hypothetical protein
MWQRRVVYSMADRKQRKGIKEGPVQDIVQGHTLVTFFSN